MPVVGQLLEIRTQMRFRKCAARNFLGANGPTSGAIPSEGKASTEVVQIPERESKLIVHRVVTVVVEFLVIQLVSVIEREFVSIKFS